MPAPHPPSIEPPPAPGDFLFSPEQLAEITDAETKHGIYTADRCPENKKRAIVRLTIEGMNSYEIAQIVQVDRRTIHAVCNDPECAAEIDKVRQALAPKLRRVAWSQLDRLERFPDSLPTQAIAFAVERCLTQAALEEGKATSRVEHVERIDIFADFEKVVKEYLPVDAEVIPEKNGASEIHYEPEKPRLMAPGADEP